jgi:hypothetical protein
MKARDRKGREMERYRDGEIKRWRDRGGRGSEEKTFYLFFLCW